MAKITVHPGGFIKRNYLDALGLTATELADALEVSESALSRLVHEKIDLSQALAVKVASRKPSTRLRRRQRRPSEQPTTDS
jgi:addiction module HigA family antidote